MRFRNLPIAVKFSLLLLPSVAFLVISLAFLQAWISSSSLEAKGITELGQKNELISGMIDSYNKSLKHTVARLAETFIGYYPGRYELDQSQLVRVGDNDAPVLRVGGHTTNLDFSAVDRFSEQTGGVATMFARKGDDFIRVATSLKNEKGGRVIGTMLTPNSPAYPAMQRGEVYVGKARLFGRDYVTQYTPIKNADGRVIAISFVGLDFTEGLKIFQEHIAAIKVGESGFVFVIDASEGKNKGIAIVHQKQQGDNMLDAKDASGRYFIQEMLAAKNGTTRYAYVDAKEPGAKPEKKIVAFNTFEDWKWLIASSAYADEFSKEATTVRNYTMAATALILILMGGLIYLAAKVWIATPLETAMQATRRFASGDLTVKLKSESSDEIGCLLQSIQDMNDNLVGIVRQVHGSAEEVSHAASQLSLAAKRVTLESSRQSKAATQAAQAVEDTSSNISAAADTAEEVRRLSEGSLTSTATGNERLVEMVSELDRAGVSVQQVSAAVNDFVKSTNSIASMTRQVKEIADQTNLLALNAAIEAARAGEQGRGFAVVADEVRKLAEKSARSATEIDSVTESLGVKSSAVEAAIANGERSLESCQALIRHTVETLAGANEAVSQAAQGAQRIAASVKEQATVSGEISRTVHGIVEMGEANRADLEQTSAAATHLEELARALQQCVSKFRIS